MLAAVAWDDLAAALRGGDSAERASDGVRHWWETQDLKTDLCASCGRWVPEPEHLPDADNEEAWAYLGIAHAEGCPWLTSRGGAVETRPEWRITYREFVHRLRVAGWECAGDALRHPGGQVLADRARLYIGSDGRETTSEDPHAKRLEADLLWRLIASFAPERSDNQ
jgi:hypothetical protein